MKKRLQSEDEKEDAEVVSGEAYEHDGIRLSTLKSVPNHFSLVSNEGNINNNSVSQKEGGSLSTINNNSVSLIEVDTSALKKDKNDVSIIDEMPELKSEDGAPESNKDLQR